MEVIISSLENIKRLFNIINSINNLPSPGVNVSCPHCHSIKAKLNSDDLLQCLECNNIIPKNGWCTQITSIISLPNDNYGVEITGLEIERITNENDKTFAEDMLQHNVLDINFTDE